MKFIPNFWCDPKNIEKLLRKIDRNVLFKEDVLQICAMFNDKASCTVEHCAESNCKRHPFSVLYRLGLVGILTVNKNSLEDEKQNFLGSNKITYIREKDCLYNDQTMIYLIHPALTKSIEKNSK